MIEYMIRRISALFLGALLALSCSQVEDVDLPMAVAHRGCWLKDGEEFYINENCPAGVKMAAQYGYPAIECDVKYTLDSVMVIMHDATINRTMRNASDYSVIEEPVKVTEHTFEELRTKYVLASTDPVALDKACLDKVYGIQPDQNNNPTPLIKRIEKQHGGHIIDHAEKIGMGRKAYKLVEL